jgi:N-methylhydantoinase B
VDPRYKNLRIAATDTIDGSDMIVDLTGTSPQVDRPINMPLIGTVDVAIYLIVRSILLDTVQHEFVPQNSGLTRPIKIIAPRGCLANPIFPAPTIARFCAGNIVADTVMRALAQVAPDRVAAGVGNMKVVAYSGLYNEQYWVYMDITEGSYGGRFGKDGMDTVDSLYANTRNNPIEDIESHYPLRVKRYEMRDGGGGPGKWRGGLGSIRDIAFLGNGGLSLEGDGNIFPPPPLYGGGEGTPGAVVFNPAAANEEQLMSKFPYKLVGDGDTISTIGPCGGGYGDPLERDPQQVLEDVLDEYVSLQEASGAYGVVLSQNGTAVDEAATQRLRAEIRARRG